jgi:hypothetical protein
MKWRKGVFAWLLAGRYLPLVLVIVPVLYLATMARGVVLGDPTEYTFVAHLLGIAHPPGYAFMTLMGKLFQTIVPFGEIAWRTHLLAVTAGTVGALLVFGTVRSVGRGKRQVTNLPYMAGALFGALVVATGVDFWQHSIHANPHIVTAGFLAANLFLLTTWAHHNKELPLLLCAMSLGLGLTHHPLTVFSWPAYGLFVLWVRPSIWREWRTVLKLAAFFLLGLSVWLYFPIRSPMEPLFGPHDMNTVEGFRWVVLAEGLRVNLFHFGAADQPGRALVFWTLLRLQYSLPVIFLAVFGLYWLGRKDLTAEGAEGTEKREREGGNRRKLAFLYGLTFLLNYAFVMNTVQDVMAYLLGPFLIVGLLAGVGLMGLLTMVEGVERGARKKGTRGNSGELGGTQDELSKEREAQGRSTLYALRSTHLLAGALFLLGPGLQVARNLPGVSLRGYEEGEAYVAAVFEEFEGSGAGAVLLNDWEHMTPLWYGRYVEERWPDEGDVRPIFVSTARPWLDLVFDYLPGGPVYLSGYRPEVVAAGFRLRPKGVFYEVVEPGEASVPPELTPVEEGAGDGVIGVVAYELPKRAVTAGDYVSFSLAMQVGVETADYYVPVVWVGEVEFEFTTDSHLITPLWLPGEVIVERFDFALPHDMAGGRYPLSVQLRNLSQNEDVGTAVDLGELVVAAQPYPIRTDHLLANFRQRVGLVSAGARNGWQQEDAPWQEAITAAPGDVIHLTLEWQSLAPAEESYTVFVHLIDLANRPVVALDYTPLGGATPTHLWIPKWLPGQRLLDPYRLEIPADLPAGTYLIEVGLYEMSRTTYGGRRLHMADAAGNLVGDRYILGAVEVRSGRVSSEQ